MIELCFVRSISRKDKKVTASLIWSVFESGAILTILAEKTGQFLPEDLCGRTETWQTGGPSPMLGQNHHFQRRGPEKLPMPIERYRKQTERF